MARPHLSSSSNNWILPCSYQQLCGKVHTKYADHSRQDRTHYGIDQRNPSNVRRRLFSCQQWQAPHLGLDLPDRFDIDFGTPNYFWRYHWVLALCNKFVFCHWQRSTARTPSQTHRPRCSCLLLPDHSIFSIDRILVSGCTGTLRQDAYRAMSARPKWEEYSGTPATFWRHRSQPCFWFARLECDGTLCQRTTSLLHARARHLNSGNWTSWNFQTQWSALFTSPTLHILWQQCTELSRKWYPIRKATLDS